MIEIYMAAGAALEEVPEVKWIDIGPRVEDHTSLYPAVFLSIDDIRPLNTLGGMSYEAELDLTVEIWIKPYTSSTSKPLSPVLNRLSDKMSVIRAVSRAIYNLEGKWIRSTTMVNETLTKQRDGFYRVVQKWKASTFIDEDEINRLADPPKLEMNSSME